MYFIMNFYIYALILNSHQNGLKLNKKNLNKKSNKFYYNLFKYSYLILIEEKWERIKYNDLIEDNEMYNLEID